jgi:Rft protein
MLDDSGLGLGVVLLVTLAGCCRRQAALSQAAGAAGARGRHCRLAVSGVRPGVRLAAAAPAVRPAVVRHRRTCGAVPVLVVHPAIGGQCYACLLISVTCTCLCFTRSTSSGRPLVDCVLHRAPQVNGILEAYVHASASSRQLVHINVGLILFAAAHLALSVLLVRLGDALGEHKTA